jgi:hypothetical protein
MMDRPTIPMQLRALFADEHPWVRVIDKPDRGARAVGPGVVDAFLFRSGAGRCRVRLSLQAGCGYQVSGGVLRKSARKFDGNPKLGAASGKPFLPVDGKLIPERTNDEMVAGQINFYRRACFDAIGGFVQEVHWDAIAFHRARMAGWTTRSFHDESLRFLHLRLMGSSERGIVTGRKRWGKGQYFIGTHPL